MPMHDWTRVEAGMYHDFHGEWLYALKHALNSGLLPGEFYATVDQKVSGSLGIGPDILALDASPTPATPTQPQPAVATLSTVARSPRRASQRRLLVRHVSEHRIVALVELVSPGNKETADDLSTFVEKVATALEEGIQVTIIDPFRPTRRHPGGTHAAVLKRLKARTTLRLPAGRPLAASAFEVSVIRLRALVEPFAVGQRVPDIPLFLVDGDYVSLPLEETYTRAFAGYPRQWRGWLTATP